MSAKISIILPTYNCGAYIGEAIRSVIAQTHADWELIIIDDASSDNTGEVVRSFAGPRIRYERSQRNMGQSWCRNRAIDLVTGQWTALLDADDRLSPKRLELLLGVGESFGADAVADDVFLWKDGSDAEPSDTLYSSIGVRLSAPEQIDVPDYLTMRLCGKRTEVPGWIKPMIRTEFLRSHNIRFDESIRMSEDYLFYCACMNAGARFFLVPDALYWYRRHPGTTSDLRLSAWALTQVALRDRMLQLEMVRREPRIEQFNIREREAMIFAEKYWLVREAVQRREVLVGAWRLFSSPSFAVKFIWRRVVEGVTRRWKAMCLGGADFSANASGG